MVKLEHSEKLKRPMRKDDLDEIGISTITKIIEAIDEGRLEEAKSLVKYLTHEGKAVHDASADWLWSWYTYVAKKYGEGELCKASVTTQRPWVTSFIKNFKEFSPKERMEFLAEHMRSHRCGPKDAGNIAVKDEGDRYVLEFDPCGSGGRMRRGDPVDGSPPRTEPPFNFYTIKGAYPWTWNKKRIPAYCMHCCINEHLQLELAGDLLWITDFQDDPKEPCRWLVYKEPEKIPEEYYTRIGKKKGSGRRRSIKRGRSR